MKNKQPKTISDILDGFDDELPEIHGRRLPSMVKQYIRKEIEELLDWLEMDWDCDADDSYFIGGYINAVEKFNKKLAQVRGEEKEDGG